MNNAATQEDFIYMTSTMEKTGTNEVKLTVTVSQAQFQQAIDKAYLRVRTGINIPGFRKGKAPRKVIENYYSEAVFYDEACNEAIPAAYDAAVDELGIFPVDQPDIDVVDMGPGKDLVFTAAVTVKPEVQLGEYKGLSVQKPEYYVTDEDVQAEIDQALERVARWEDTTDRPVQTGDRITLDYAGSVDGVAFPGGTAQDQSLEIGSGSFIPGFEEQVVGMSIDEERDLNVTFPEEYHADELAGKQAVFHVKVLSIKAKELPELDDEFAKDVSDADTLEQYRQQIRERLEQANTKRAQNEYEDALVEAATANATVEIPHSMIHRQAQAMAQEFEYRLAYQGIKMEDYLRMTGLDQQAVLEQYHEQAEQRVKTSLVLEAIQQAENVAVTDEDIDAELDQMAQGREQSAKDMKRIIQPQERDYMRQSLLARKTLELLQSSAQAAAEPAPQAD